MSAMSIAVWMFDHLPFLYGPPHQWYRRQKGGHWELWHLSYPGPADLWMQADYCQSGGRPILGHGRPTCEEW